MPLKFTKNQTLILEIFYNHPEKSYYLREIARLMGKEPGVFQRGINKLTENKILISKYKANSRFFRLNQAHPLYSELKSIFLKTYGAEAKLRASLKKIKNIEISFIYGSFARGREDQFSDIDLMIIGNPDENILISKISSVEKDLEREINYNIFSVKDFKRGLIKKEIFLEEILDQPKIFIIGDQNVLEKIIRK